MSTRDCKIFSLEAPQLLTKSGFDDTIKSIVEEKSSL
jgi:hypothetical protein